MSPETVSGSCLCGGVTFRVTLPFLRAGICHCSRCRKHSGSGAAIQGRVPRERFLLLTGEDLVRIFRPEGGASKAFCSRCGSSLFGGTWPDGPEVSIRFGTLDGDPGIRPQEHTFVEEMAPWDAITDDLPRHRGRRPAREEREECRKERTP